MDKNISENDGYNYCLDWNFIQMLNKDSNLAPTLYVYYFHGLEFFNCELCTRRTFEKIRSEIISNWDSYEDTIKKNIKLDDVKDRVYSGKIRNTMKLSLQILVETVMKESNHESSKK